MRIGIDATPLTIPFPCGGKSYTENLIISLAKVDKKNSYVLFASKKVKFPKAINFKLVVTPSLFPFFKRQFFLSYYAKKENLDVFHFTQPFGDVFFNHPAIVTTVHDVDLDQTYPHFSKYLANRIICDVTRSGVFRNTKIFLTGTDVIKKELKEFLHSMSISRFITTIAYAPDDSFKLFKGLKKGNYILCFGDFSNRKNTGGVILAYSKLPGSIRREFGLSIVSSTESASQKFRDMVYKLNISSSVKILTGVSNKRLSDLYQRATVFVFPSFYEGFGIPVLEAMASGCPVITSNYGSMAEVAGSSALLIDPNSVDQIEKAIADVVTNKSLQNRLASKGLKRATAFSWELTAKKTLEAYKSASTPKA